MFTPLEVVATAYACLSTFMWLRREKEADKLDELRRQHHTNLHLLAWLVIQLVYESDKIINLGTAKKYTTERFRLIELLRSLNLHPEQQQRLV